MNNKSDIGSLFSTARPFLAQHATCDTQSAVCHPDDARQVHGPGQLNRKSKIKNQKSARAFSLVELLVVIAIIAIIAAILLPVGNMIALKSRIQSAQAEEKALETAIDTYHSHYGFYPPSNTNSAFAGALTNQLYYELIGTTVTSSSAGTNFITLDNSSTISANHVVQCFGVPSFMNCTTGSGEDAHPAQTFLPGLKPGQMATNIYGVYVITTAVVSDAIYQPLQGYSTLSGRTANPWRYLCPGINNPSSYDLWVQIFIGGKTNLICNWKTTPQINSSMP